MNEVFASYSASTAFFVQLSKNQCNMLLRLHAAIGKFDFSAADRANVNNRIQQWYDAGLGVLQVGPMKSLEARGLIFWHRLPNGEANGFGGLTKAGMLMCELLKEAGMTIENTNTVSVLKRLDREAA